jgi:predicted ATPase with chaperone activity
MATASAGVRARRRRCTAISAASRGRCWTGSTCTWRCPPCATATWPTGEHCAIGEGGDALLRTAITRLGLSARAYHRVLKIARTIADLEGGGAITTQHVSEAIQYRSLDRAGGPAAMPAVA